MSRGILPIVAEVGEHLFGRLGFILGVLLSDLESAVEFYGFVVYPSTTRFY